MYVLSENTKLFRTFDGPVEHIDRFSIRVRAYSETQTWFVEATNGWSFSQQGNVLAFVAVSDPDVRREITHTLADRVWKHVNEYVATIDANIVSLYVNGESVHNGSVDAPAFDFEPWSVLQLHGGTSPKTIFDVLQIEHNTVWMASNVQDMYAASRAETNTDDRLIQFVSTPAGSVRHDMFDGNIEDTGRMSVRVKTDKATSSWALTASDSWVFRYESNVLTFEEPQKQTKRVDLTEHVAQSVSNVSDYLVNVERRNVHFFFNGRKVDTQPRDPNTFSWSHANIESESGPVHLTEILVNEAWSSDYIANVFTA